MILYEVLPAWVHNLTYTTSPLCLKTLTQTSLSQWITKADFHLLQNVARATVVLLKLNSFLLGCKWKLLRQKDKVLHATFCTKCKENISISTKTKHDISSGTFEDKTTRIFLRFILCLVLGLCLDYDLMLTFMTIFMSQAWLDSFVLLLVLSLCLC